LKNSDSAERELKARQRALIADYERMIRLDELRAEDPIQKARCESILAMFAKGQLGFSRFDPLAHEHLQKFLSNLTKT
jgi:hypothetical protein